MRSPLLPNVPTANEAGAGGFDVTAWNGLFVRTGTPAAIVAQLNSAMREVLAGEDLKQRLLEMGISPTRPRPRSSRPSSRTTSPNGPPSSPKTRSSSARLRQCAADGCVIGRDSETQVSDPHSSARAAGKSRNRKGKSCRAAETGARRQGAAQLHRSGEPYPEDQGRLYPGLQRPGCGRWDAQIIVAHGLTPSMSDQGQLVPLSMPSRTISAASRRRPPPTPATAARRTLPRSAARGIAGYIATGRAKHPGDVKRKIGGPLTQAMRRQAEAGGMAQPLPIAKADRGAGVRTDQAGTRLPPVPVARRRESACRVGDDLHRPQPHQARQAV